MKAADGTQTLFLRVEITESAVKSYDAAGALLHETGNYLSGEEGGYFNIFNHMGHTVIDNVTVKAY